AVAGTDDGDDGRAATGFGCRARPFVVAPLRAGQGPVDADHQRHRSREDPYGTGARGPLRVADHGVADATLDRRVAGRAGAVHRFARRPERRAIQLRNCAGPVDLPCGREARAGARAGLAEDAGSRSGRAPVRWLNPASRATHAVHGAKATRSSDTASSRIRPAPRTTHVSGSLAIVIGRSVSRLSNRSSPGSSAPPPVNVMPLSTMSAASSGGVS